MQVTLNNYINFNIDSFCEVLRVDQDENGPVTHLLLDININYAESLANLFTLFKDVDTYSIVISGAENKERRYDNFVLINIDQNVENFHNITTVLRFVKGKDEVVQ